MTTFPKISEISKAIDKHMFLLFFYIVKNYKRKLNILEKIEREEINVTGNKGK